MPTAFSVTCAGCGAPLPTPAEPQTVECPYCGRSQLAGPPPARPPYLPPAPYPGPPPMPVQLDPAAAKAGVIIAAVSGVLLLAGIGGAILAASSTSGEPFVSSPIGRPETGPGAGGVVPSGEHLQWWPNGMNLVPVQLGDDATEDFVGVYRILELGSGTQGMFVGAFDGATFARKWASGPYGTLSDSATSTHVGVAGRRVVVTDFRSLAHVLDLSTGKEVVAAQLTDRARFVCSPPDAGNDVWIEVADDKDVLLDVTTGKARPSKRPDWCPPKQGDGCLGARAVCLDGDSSLKTPGMRVDTVLREGGLSVGVGSKSPGTAVPMVAGLDFEKKTAKWQVPIAADPTTSTVSFDPAVELRGGRLYVTHATSGDRGQHLVAMDATNGQRLWDTVIPRSEDGSGPEMMVVTRSRVYVPHWTWLDIFDVRDGKYLVTVGIW